MKCDHYACPEQTADLHDLRDAFAYLLKGQHDLSLAIFSRLLNSRELDVLRGVIEGLPSCPR